MIILKAELTIHTEEKERFLEHMQTLIAESRQEVGCLSFGCYEDVSARGTFLILQEWESWDALNLHESSAHLAHFKVQVRPMIASRDAARVYTISGQSGLEG